MSTKFDDDNYDTYILKCNSNNGRVMCSYIIHYLHVELQAFCNS